MSSSKRTVDSPLKVMSPADAQTVADTTLSLVTAKDARVQVSTHSTAGIEFARNKIRNVTGISESVVGLTLSVAGREVIASTQDMTPEGLAALVNATETMAEQRTSRVEPEELVLDAPAELLNPSGLYFESTLASAALEAQEALVQTAIKPAERAGMITAGRISSESESLLVSSTTGYKGYSRKTYSEFSMTARTRSGTGSGWARYGTEDSANVNVPGIAGRAIDLAKRNEDPVAVEPGRYTVILEPEALAALIWQISRTPSAFLEARAADLGILVFAKEGGGNKIGQQMTDARVQLLYDPMDPLMPIMPLDENYGPLRRTHWIENGILKNLAYIPSYARKQKREVVINPANGKNLRLEVSGETQTREEMIASTKRGIWIHRLDGISLMNPSVMLFTGMTRDGTFLIENGKVTRPVKNMRFMESPFFILNKIDAFGEPVRSEKTVVCPRLKVHDFEFTSLSDSI